MEFKAIGTRCYFIEDVNKLSWLDANVSCEAKGAQLIKIDNLNEKESIQHELGGYLGDQHRKRVDCSVMNRCQTNSNKYAHCTRFIVFCCGLVSTD